MNNYMNNEDAASMMLNVLRRKYKSAKTTFAKRAIVAQAEKILDVFPDLREDHEPGPKFVVRINDRCGFMDCGIVGEQALDAWGSANMSGASVVPLTKQSVIERLYVSAAVAIDDDGEPKLVVAFGDGKGNNSHRLMKINLCDGFDRDDAARLYVSKIAMAAIVEYAADIPTMWDHWVEMFVDPDIWTQTGMHWTDKVLVQCGSSSFKWHLLNDANMDYEPHAAVQILTAHD